MGGRIVTTYQLMPPLSAEEFAALRADVAEHGIRVPIDVDEHGVILDGHHRARVAAELGVALPTRVLTGLTEQDKREHAVAVNAHRRMLSREQRRGLVRAELERDPDRSDRAIGRVCGVDHKTVGAMRRGGWGTPHPDEMTPVEVQQARELTAEITRGMNDILRGFVEIVAEGTASAAWVASRVRSEYGAVVEQFDPEIAWALRLLLAGIYDELAALDVALLPPQEWRADDPESRVWLQAWAEARPDAHAELTAGWRASLAESGAGG